MAPDLAGVASFSVDGTSFRYKVSVTPDGLLQIWLEDRDSKAQWQTKKLKLEDFVTTENMLAQATMTDYATQLAASLGSTDVTVKTLSDATASGTRNLELRLALGALSFAVTLVYRFELSPVELEKTDVLTAQIRDLKDALAALEGRVAAVETRRGYY